jgi:hypothetical protein
VATDTLATAELLLDKVEERRMTVRSHYQGTAGEDAAGWKKLSGCYGDL